MRVVFAIDYMSALRKRHKTRWRSDEMKTGQKHQESEQSGRQSKGQ